MKQYNWKSNPTPYLCTTRSTSKKNNNKRTLNLLNLAHNDVLKFNHCSVIPQAWNSQEPLNDFWSFAVFGELCTYRLEVSDAVSSPIGSIVKNYKSHQSRPEGKSSSHLIKEPTLLLSVNQGWLNTPWRKLCRGSMDPAGEPQPVLANVNICPHTRAHTHTLSGAVAKGQKEVTCCCSTAGFTSWSTVHTGSAPTPGYIQHLIKLDLWALTLIICLLQV